MTHGGNSLSLIRKIALIALLALAGAGGEITPIECACGGALRDSLTNDALQGVLLTDTPQIIAYLIAIH